LVLFLLLPCNILYAFFGVNGWEMLVPFMHLFIIALVQIVSAFFLGLYVFYRTYPDAQKKVLVFSTHISNAALIGTPMAESVYGIQGITYASIFLLPMRIFIYSVGHRIFTGKSSIKKAVFHPCLVFTYIGIIVMLTGFTPPGFIVMALRGIGNCTTPLSMIVVGNILVQVKINNVITKTVLYYSFIRLIFIPLALMGILLLLDLDSITCGVSVILAGMPAPSLGIIMAEKYGADSELAAKIIFVTMLLSMVTAPALIFLIQIFW